MLPAYMYDKYIGPLENSASRKEVQPDLDMTVAKRMTSEAAGDVYGKAMDTRKKVTEQYGVNTSAVSGEETRTVDGMYNELSGDNKFKVSDFVDK